MNDILSHPLVEALNPAGKTFLKAQVLSAALNPFALEISVVSVQSLPSLKAIPAFEMLMQDHCAGRHAGKDILVVPSSGNTAYAVARLAPAFGFARVLVVVSAEVPPFKRSIIAALPTVEIVEYPRNTMEEAKRLTEKLGARALLLDQYGHEANRAAHARYTAPELLRAMGGQLDLVITALGSAGTAMGLAQFFRHCANTPVLLGAQPQLGEKAPGTRDACGIAVVPFAWRAMLDDVVLGSELGARARMRQLWSEVEPTPGPSAGLSFDCLLRYLEALPASARARLNGKRAAILCHDSGLLYPEYATQAAAPTVSAAPIVQKYRAQG